MSSPHHITLRDIATAAGVHVSTVSLALRDDARLPAATRLRVKKIAQRLGYASNALLGSLARYRSRSSASPERPRIAWVTLHPTADGWRKFQTAQQSFHGAKQAARALGYTLRCIWLGGAGMTSERATRRLQLQKIVGLIVAPAPKPTVTLKLPWEDYPAVGIGLTVVSPQLHVTANHHYRSAKLAVRELAARGYKRIGLVLLARANDRVEQSWLGGSLVMAYEEAGTEIVPPLVLEQLNQAALRRWYQQHRPDAIVTRHLELRPLLAKLGVTAPRDVGFALLSVPDRSGALAGIDENARAIGAGAMALLADLITRGEKGIPADPQRLLFEGTWIEGRTVRARRPLMI